MISTSGGSHSIPVSVDNKPLLLLIYAGSGSASIDTKVFSTKPSVQFKGTTALMFRASPPIVKSVAVIFLANPRNDHSSKVGINSNRLNCMELSASLIEPATVTKSPRFKSSIDAIPARTVSPVT